MSAAQRPAAGADVMLHTHPPHEDTASGLAQCRWVDLLCPTEDEAARVADAFGIDVPSQAALEEIESTSRLRSNGDTLYMSAPLISVSKEGEWHAAPTGFILSPRACVSIRFHDMEAFEAVAKALDGQDVEPAEIVVRLLEEVVDRSADHLERGSQTVTMAAHEIFSEDEHGRRKRLSHDTARLRARMKQAGRISEKIAQVRYSFLSIGRMAGYMLDRCTPKLAEPLRDRLTAMQRDIASLDEFEASLSNRIQLLQDAATGFISIEQNDVVKVLTVASTVGVPPVLVVGLYGMNFQYMPELHWRYGYPFAIALMILSGALPFAWFKWRDWI